MKRKKTKNSEHKVNNKTKNDQNVKNDDGKNKNNICLFPVFFFYSRLWLIISQTFSLQSFRHVGCNIIDQLTETRERTPPVQVTQTVN